MSKQEIPVSLNQNQNQPLPEAPEKKKRGRPKGSKNKPKKLNIGFTPDSGDIEPPQLQDNLSESAEPVIDYHAVSSGLVSMMDSMLKLVSKISKNRLEYEPLNNSEKEILAESLQQEKPLLEFMGKTSGINHLVVIATFAGVMSSKIKVNKPVKQEKVEVKKTKLEEGKNEKPIPIIEEKVEFEKLDEKKEVPL